jgi:hypothetical protein
MVGSSDTLFSLISIETSSLSLSAQLDNPEQSVEAHAKLSEAIANHQKTLGRLMRMQPLHAMGLALSLAMELGAMQSLARRADFTPSSYDWKAKSTRWKSLQTHARKMVLQDAKKIKSKKEAKPMPTADSNSSAIRQPPAIKNEPLPYAPQTPG